MCDKKIGNPHCGSNKMNYLCDNLMEINLISIKL